jgi:hypothetical protein
MSAMSEQDYFTRLSAADDFTRLPYVLVFMFVQPSDIEAAERQLHALRPGDKRADFAAELGEATKYAQGYRIEWADDGFVEPTPAPLPEPAPSPIRLRGLLAPRRQ